jgi:sigma-E factor negative regulatory protein RseB
MRRSSAMKQGDSGDLVGIPTRFPADAIGPQLFLLLSLLALCCGEVVASARTPVEQLVRMANALRSLSYEGDIVYLHGNTLEALRIVHRVEKGQVHEKLVSLNGPVRTLTREKGGVTCKLSGSKPISVQRHGVGKDVLHAWTLDPGALSAHYRLHPLGRARVAGRQTEVVGIIPRDRLRYGYRFYLDRDSGLPLKSDLMGRQAKPVQQIMFTSLNLLPSADSGAAVEDPPPEKRQSKAESATLGRVSWRFVSLPPGFALVRHDNWTDIGGQPVEHFVLSDGLASVSVYVERDPREGLVGETSIGAVHAVGHRVSSHQITVVGEVPSETVEAVLAGIRHDGGGTP